MSEPLVLAHDVGPVRWLTLNRPQKRNALGASLTTQLQQALKEAKNGPARCVAITGAGTAFSAGADLEELLALRTASHEENLADSHRLAELLKKIAKHPLPVVAAVNGPAIAGGAGLAIACDLTVAADDAIMAFTEVRVGFVPAIILNFLLRTVGEKAIRDLCLTGRRISMSEAKQLGLVHRVVPHDQLTQAVAELGSRFEKASPAAIATTKQLFLKLRHLPLDKGLLLAAEENASVRATPDCREGIAAFLEKRKPKWTS
ncbi:MAG: enoyl-CoA hydratase/isomerase family protein [Planctomycetota bacterium]|jgi:methylglutaconyl-CoA hydratase